MTDIGDLDADRTRVDVVFSGPRRSAGVPGAAVLGDKRQDAPVLMDEIVRRNLAVAAAQPGERLIVVRHAGVMQEQDVDRGAPLAMVGREPMLDVQPRHAGARWRSILAQAPLMAASRSLAMRTNSSGTPRAISRSGWFSATRRR